MHFILILNFVLCDLVKVSRLLNFNLLTIIFNCNFTYMLLDNLCGDNKRVHSIIFCTCENNTYSGGSRERSVNKPR